MPVAVAMVAVAMAMPSIGALRCVLVVVVMLRRIADRFEVVGDVRGEGFAADVLQIVGGFVAVRAVGGVFFVMTVMAVGAVDERAGDLHDAVEMDERNAQIASAPVVVGVPVAVPPMCDSLAA